MISPPHHTRRRGPGEHLQYGPPGRTNTRITLDRDESAEIETSTGLDRIQQLGLQGRG